LEISKLTLPSFSRSFDFPQPLQILFQFWWSIILSKLSVGLPAIFKISVYISLHLVLDSWYQLKMLSMPAREDALNMYVHLIAVPLVTFIFYFILFNFLVWFIESCLV